MTKAEKDQLEKYKQSDKARKLVLLARMGFKTQEKYFESMGVSKKAPAKVAKKAVKVTKEVSDGKPTDYVVAFDCTGSMAGYIGAVKEHVVDLVKKLVTNSPDLRMKIVAFGDYCDMEGAGVFGKAYQTIELTNDQNALIKFVQTSQNTSGGDSDEFYELVIRKINRETSWRKDAAKAVLLIGDAYCHSLHYRGLPQGAINTIDWRKEAEEAKSLGIQYDTLLIDPAIQWYGELSKITGGVSMIFQNAAKVDSIIEGAIYARSSPKAFYAASCSAMSSGDSELIGAYKSLSTLSDALTGTTTTTSTKSTGTLTDKDK